MLFCFFFWVRGCQKCIFHFHEKKMAKNVRGGMNVNNNHNHNKRRYNGGRKNIAQKLFLANGDIEFQEDSNLKWALMPLSELKRARVNLKNHYFYHSLFGKGVRDEVMKNAHVFFQTWHGKCHYDNHEFKASVEKPAIPSIESDNPVTTEVVGTRMHCSPACAVANCKTQHDRRLLERYLRTYLGYKGILTPAGPLIEIEGYDGYPSKGLPIDTWRKKYEYPHVLSKVVPHLFIPRDLVVEELIEHPTRSCIYDNCHVGDDAKKHVDELASIIQKFQQHESSSSTSSSSSYSASAADAQNTRFDITADAIVAPQEPLTDGADCLFTRFMQGGGGSDEAHRFVFVFVCLFQKLCVCAGGLLLLLHLSKKKKKKKKKQHHHAKKFKLFDYIFFFHAC